MIAKSIGKVLLLGSLLVPASLAAQPTVEAPQGAVVRWASATAESCGMDGRTWHAVEGVCYYPIDFERAAGRIEVARWQAGQAMEKAWVDVQTKDFGEQDIEFPDDEYIHLSQENLERHWSEQAKVKPLFKRRGEAQFTLPLAAPVEPLPEGKYFGTNRSFNGESKNAHTGLDYAVGVGTPVKAVAAGTVALVDEHFFAGRSVYVDHGGGLISMYFHLDSAEAAEGDKVERGQTIARSGSSGRSTGPHLHLGLRWRGARVAPAPLLVTLDVPSLE